MGNDWGRLIRRERKKRGWADEENRNVILSMNMLSFFPTLLLPFSGTPSRPCYCSCLSMSFPQRVLKESG